MTATLFVLLSSLLIAHVGFFPGWFDAGELAAAADLLGVAHPTGHPLFLILGKMTALFPFGSISFRISLLSVLSVAGAAILIGKLSGWVVLGGLILLHPSIGLQATRPEVYALQFALSIATVWMVIQLFQTRDVRWAFMLFLTVGLSLALQPVLTVTLIPAYAVAIWIWVRESKRIPWAGFGWLLLGLSVYLYLPLRAQADPVINWDSPTTLARFIQVLTGKDYQVYFHAPLADRALQDLARGEVLTLLPIALLLAAMYAVYRHRKSTTVVFLACSFLSGLGAWLLKNFDLQNPDAHAYVAFPIAMAFILGSIGLNDLLKPKWRPAVLLLLVLIFIPRMSDGWASWKAHGGAPAYHLSRHLGALPEGSSLVVESDHWLFPIWYHAYIEGQRPDVAVIGQGMLRASWYRDQVEKQYGSLERRPLVREMADPIQTPHQIGYLFSEKESNPHSRKSFASVCRIANQTDPFSIGASICSKVVTLAAGGMLQQKRYSNAISLLEEYLDLPQSGMLCDHPQVVRLPFPLLRDQKQWFVEDPHRPAVDLQLLYWGCGFPEKSVNVWRERSADAGLDGSRLADYAKASMSQSK